MRKIIAFVILVFVAASLSYADYHDIRSYIDRGDYYADTDTLTAAATYSDSVWVVGAELLLCEVFVYGITTSVVVRLEGSNDRVGWTDISGSQTLTADGTYGISFSQAPIYRYYTMHWISEAGGTAAKMIVKFKPGGRVNAAR